MLLTAESGLRGRVFDLDTGRRVPKVIELNTETGYLRAYRVVVQDDRHPEREVICTNADGEQEWYEAHGRFRFVPTNNSITPPVRVVLGAAVCSCCRSPLTLPGDDLCPPCRARERGQRNRFLVERLTTPLFNCRCLVCSRLATWSVADEVDVTPARQGQYLYERGMIVGRRYYCDVHYQPARLLDDRGEVIRELRYAGPDTLTMQGVQGG